MGGSHENVKCAGEYYKDALSQWYFFLFVTEILNEKTNSTNSIIGFKLERIYKKQNVYNTLTTVLSLLRTQTP